MTIKILRNFILIFTLAIFPLTSQANATANGAQNFIQDLSDRAIELIQAENDNDIMKTQQLSKLFEDSVDTKWIARFALGKHWKTATKAQKEVYINLHKQFLISSYVPKFKKYSNQQVVFKKYHTEGELEYLIETEIVNEGSTSISVDYKVREDENGKYQIYDVIAEGVSLITTQRSDFSSILSRKGVDYLIKKLKAKIYS